MEQTYVPCHIPWQLCGKFHAHCQSFMSTVSLLSLCFVALASSWKLQWVALTALRCSLGRAGHLIPHGQSSASKSLRSPTFSGTILRHVLYGSSAVSPATLSFHYSYLQSALMHLVLFLFPAPTPSLFITGIYSEINCTWTQAFVIASARSQTKHIVK